MDFRELNDRIHQIRILEAIDENKLSASELRELVQSLFVQINSLKELYKMEALRGPLDLTIEIPQTVQSEDTLHIALRAYLEKMEPSYRIWRDYTVSEILRELMDKNSHIAGEFVQNLLDEVFSSERFVFGKAEAFEEKHKALTQTLLKSHNVYMLIKGMATQLDRLAMLSYLQNNGYVAQADLLTSDDLRELAGALYRLFY